VRISLREKIVRALDPRSAAPRGGLSGVQATERFRKDESRWDLIESAFGAIEDGGHEWDVDAADWVRSQRSHDVPLWRD
jgi:hypothetical protein